MLTAYGHAGCPRQAPGDTSLIPWVFPSLSTFNDREGSPQLTIDFSDWNLAATLEASAFVFDPPKEAEKIVMTTIEEANAADAKGGTK